MAGGPIFTTFHLFKGYWQALPCEKCKKKRTFVYRFGTYHVGVMLSDLMNMPSRLKQVLDQLFGCFDFVKFYLDDIVI